eukprot:4278678-Pleurochrysis_carterae.AAC.1
MKLHMLGVIFHGCADKVHLFPVVPNIAGNANLICEGILRAVEIKLAITGMLPRLHVQLDNASDNKNRTVLAFFAWMEAVGWGKEVTISMMATGHTHEDIDALFMRIVERWKQLGH